MRNPRSSPASLYRRLEALEDWLDKRDELVNQAIKSAMHEISQENLELLIDATLASLQGMELNERQAAGKEAYAEALRPRCREHGLKVTRMPEAPDLIDLAAVRALSDEDLHLTLRGIRKIIGGSQPTAEELAALQVAKSNEEAQYHRIGFGSKAEFESWYASKKAAPANGVETRN